ncbi:isocitrate/isopropylmalate family dehydrogenase, partial [Saccharomonospora halophila]|uniref:isocitrate/isopropylmalate family dehydrogenase n=1 Tax=Saccharomonospora halophila TaxID=129922 RepID=UPI0005848E64
MRHTLGLIPGDGIGPEIVDATVSVLDALGAHGPEPFTPDWVPIDAGADTYRRTGAACSAEDVRRVRDA